MTMLDEAMRYLARGWSVIPANWVREDGSCSCGNPSCGDNAGKHPKVLWNDYQERLPTEAEVQRWWRTWPRANIAIVTGKVSGIIVIDVDPRHGGDESMRDLGPLPDTLTALTGGGGDHKYYRHPGRIVANGSGVNSGLRPGIDVRGDGGYVIAPPSIHRKGGVYSWEAMSPDEPAPVPPVIDAMLVHRRIGDVAPSSRHFDLQEVFERGIPDGERNETLAKVTGHYAATGASYDMVLMSVRGVNVTYCHPALEDAELVKVVESIYSREEEKRRVADAIEERLNGNGNGDAKDVVIPDERRAMARALWAELGIPNVTDWIVIRSDVIEYVLYTAEDEARLGDDLLNQNTVRKRIFNELGEVLKPIEAKLAWPKRAKMLRDLARETVADSPRAADRIDAWLEAFASEEGPVIDPAVEERAAFLQSRPVVTDGHIYLKPEVMFRFMENVMGEKMRIGELRKLLRRAGWDDSMLWTGKRSTRAWRRLYTREE